MRDEEDTDLRDAHLAAEGPDEEGLLELWDTAWRIAQRCCAKTLMRLRNGDGGFYEADDFAQDLFLEFWALVRRWSASQPACEDDLWTAWRGTLWGGGMRVLRRVPQRLWAGAEQAVDPVSLGLAYEKVERSEGVGGDRRLPRAALRALVQAEDAESTQDEAARLDELEAALWTLRPAQRQIIYMTALGDLPAAAVARLLGLGQPNAIYQRLHSARAALRRRLRADARDRDVRGETAPETETTSFDRGSE